MGTAPTGDLDEFLSALLGGRLLDAPRLAEMRTTVEAAMWPVRGTASGW